MSKLRTQPSRVVLALVATLLLAPGAGPRAAGAAAPAPPFIPPSTACWVVDGPFFDKSETYFNAVNHCSVPYHCLVWVNNHEPGYQVHVGPGEKARIDVGRAKGSDSFSSHCEPVAVAM